MNCKNSKKLKRNTINLSQAEIIDLDSEDMELYARIYTNLEGKRKVRIYKDKTKREVKDSMDLERFKTKYPMLSYMA